MTFEPYLWRANSSLDETARHTALSRQTLGPLWQALMKDAKSVRETGSADDSLSNHVESSLSRSAPSNWPQKRDCQEERDVRYLPQELGCARNLSAIHRFQSPRIWDASLTL